MNNAYAATLGRPVASAAVSVRAQFIVRTYGHLLAALLAFTAFEVFLFSSGASDRINAFFMGSPLLIFGGFLALGMVGSSLASPHRALSTQYLALTGYVLGEGVLFTPILTLANNVAPGAIQSAALVTIAGFSGLTFIAFSTRKDFSFLRSVLRWGVLVALLLIGASFLFGFHLGTFFSVAMVGLAGAAILYDTSNVLHKHATDSYVAASLQLFASVTTMFWYVLRIFISRD